MFRFQQQFVTTAYPDSQEYIMGVLMWRFQNHLCGREHIVAIVGQQHSSRPLLVIQVTDEAADDIVSMTEFMGAKVEIFNVDEYRRKENRETEEKLNRMLQLI